MRSKHHRNSYQRRGFQDPYILLLYKLLIYVIPFFVWYLHLHMAIKWESNCYYMMGNKPEHYHLYSLFSSLCSLKNRHTNQCFPLCYSLFIWVCVCVCGCVVVSLVRENNETCLCITLIYWRDCHKIFSPT